MFVKSVSFKEKKDASSLEDVNNSSPKLEEEVYKDWEDSFKGIVGFGERLSGIIIWLSSNSKICGSILFGIEFSISLWESHDSIRSITSLSKCPKSSLNS